ncbi:DUF5700 domain-containing putative Zn-dependent protease [Pedobacter nutrimenti]|uniref:DUF5700 domain-containing putative Zn-dependent protease n=1 Tax=Pedobacter nutrimenti TaxID=1241337 RepID=UPI002931AD8C|nr:DUF5700 domain-containing putative Zn-dependent protease [Pedobacter nutrimenti]
MNCALFAQTDKRKTKEVQETIDVAAAGLYFQIADTMQAQKQPSSALWNSFFNMPINQMLISGQRLDSGSFKKEMYGVYSSLDKGAGTMTESELYHLEYKKMLPELKAYLAKLQSMGIAQKVKKYLYPYIPAAYRNDRFLPKQYYIFYGTEDATGMNGMVINDLLLSYKLDSYVPGTLSAHEAYHAINNKEFNDKIRKSIDWGDTRSQVFMFINLLAEEGVADQIDKKLIFSSRSPAKASWNDINENYENNSKAFIERTDSLFRRLNRDSAHRVSQNDFFSLYSKFGGHWPGRLMGEVILNNGMIKDLFVNFKDPFHFILVYNQAAKKDRSKPPYFSDEALEYLKKVKKYCLK